MSLKKRALQRMPELSGEAREQEPDLAELLAQLIDVDEDIRRYAAQDLRGHEEAVPDLLSRLKFEPSRPVAQTILDSLVELGGKNVAHGLVPYLRSDDAYLRTSAFEALLALHELSLEALTPLMEDDDVDVRLFAVQLVARIGGEDAYDLVVNRLPSEADVNVASAIIEWLGETGERRAVPAIERAKERFEGSEYFLFAAEVSLRRIGAAS